MSEAPEIVVGRLVRCHHAQMSRPFIARVCQVFGNRLVVEVMNFHFHDRRIVEENRYKLVVEANDAKTMAIVQCQRRKG
ncbi:MAG TPA: hypothetical protein DDW71_04730 [Lactobacillus sp.]|uniref:DUF2187 domain-containing protein n=1 Tax=Secundilactobacillus silagincola TaxID=1714681 RepID=A0A1Z5J343_9LACO|nr:hypothetical protein [Secundilactobacillus silagincola]GAX08464.1 hypothetical protein IWT5_01619 [Secundilactobacillus silagincola]HBF74543.1 hypothetical protein [Lactobacillus sp.]